MKKTKTQTKASEPTRHVWIIEFALSHGDHWWPIPSERDGHRTRGVAGYRTRKDAYEVVAGYRARHLTVKLRVVKYWGVKP